jgi:hypothetical protein
MTDQPTNSRRRLTDEALVLMHVPGLKLVTHRPAGYREMQEIKQVSEKAIQFRYYGWLLWIPKRSTVQVRGKREFWAAAWAVDSAKESGFARQVDREC